VVLGGRPYPHRLPGVPGPSTVVGEGRSVEDRSRPAWIRSDTVVHDRSAQPEGCVAVLELDDGARTVARRETTPAGHLTGAGRCESMCHATGDRCRTPASRHGGVPDG